MEVRQAIKEIAGKPVYNLSFNLKGDIIFFPFYTQNDSVCDEAFGGFFGKPFPFSVMLLRGDELSWMIPKDEWEEAATLLIDSFQDPMFFKEFQAGVEKDFKLLEELIARLESVKEWEPEKTKLLALYEEYLKTMNSFRVRALVPNIISFGKRSLAKEYRKLLSVDIPPKSFAKLTSPHERSRSMLSERDLLLMIRNNEVDERSINKWRKNWGYLHYYYIGPLPSKETVHRMIDELKGEKVQERLEQIDGYEALLREEKAELIRQFGLSAQDCHLLDVLAYLTFYKLERKELMQKGYVAFDNVFDKLSAMTGVAVNDLKLLMLPETRKLLEDGVVPQEAIARRKESFLYLSSLQGSWMFDEERMVQDILSALSMEELSQEMTIAYAGGKVTGRMVVVNCKEDMEKIKDLQEPFILASNSTYPELLPAMTKAAGIITRIGGMTSHAAIVSREMRKPCVVGFSKLFETFKEGDVLELDSDKGVVRKA